VRVTGCSDKQYGPDGGELQTRFAVADGQWTDLILQLLSVVERTVGDTQVPLTVVIGVLSRPV
jgi:hypothetical protein